MLTNQLRELEADGLIIRKIYPQVPPKVEYSLSTRGRTLKPVIKALKAWGDAHLGAPPIAPDKRQRNLRGPLVSIPPR
jgi:DNA-binding HxlR family transcriptional regulator